jgi:AraC-like DNA-binding protein
MNPVTKALWFIEGHFAGEITLAAIAEAAGVSRFHMVRAFGTTTGHSCASPNSFTRFSPTTSTSRPYAERS